MRAAMALVSMNRAGAYDALAEGCLPKASGLDGSNRPFCLLAVR